MKVNLLRKNDNYLFECTNSAGHKILMDNSSLPDAQGVSPMEVILMATAGCSGIDMVSILKKQRQSITHLSAEVVGDRHQVDEAKPFNKISVVFTLEGEIDATKAYKAAELSFEKYCSVSKTLNPRIPIDFQIIVNGEPVNK